MGGERLPWFRCRPDRLLGALAGMGPDAGYLYTILLMRIYENGGPVRETSQTLSRRTGLVQRRAAQALSWLIDAGKIEVREDGKLDSSTTHEEIKWQSERSEQVANAGRKSGENRAKNKANVAPQSIDENPAEKPQQNQREAPAAAEQLSEDKDRDKEREDTLGADAPKGGEPPGKPTDPTELLWFEGLPLLLSMDASEREARGCIGKWLKATHNNADLVLAAIQRARDKGTRDPIPLVTRILQPQGQPSLAVINGTGRHVQASSGKRTLGDELAEIRAELGMH